MELEIGQRFGRLVVVKKSSSLINYYDCNCDCGKKTTVDYKSLIYDRSHSCGCLQRENVSAKAKELRGINENELIGKKFNRWTVIEVDGKDKHGQWLYRCRCECGKEKAIHRNSLLTGKSKSCGCFNSEETTKRLQKRHKEDDSWKEFIGKKFERLTVIGRTEEKIDNRYYYICKCDCGKEIKVAKNNLVAGRTRSCGCLNNKVLKERHRQYRIDHGYNPDTILVNDINYIRGETFDKIKFLILKVDKNVCKLCGNGIQLNVHHIEPVFSFLNIDDKNTYEKLYKYTNLITLCESCHKKAHGQSSKDINIEIQKQLLQLALKRKNISTILKEYENIVKEIIIPFIKSDFYYKLQKYKSNE